MNLRRISGPERFSFIAKIPVGSGAQRLRLPVLVAILSLCCVSALQPHAAIEPIQKDEDGLPNFEPHPSIIVHGDAEFETTRSGVRHGSGEPHDPYVISDWIIIKTADVGVRIANTRAHVIIKNVFLDGPEGALTRVVEPHCVRPQGICGTAGFHFDNATNISIMNVRVSSAGDAVRIENSKAVIFDGAVLGRNGDVPGVRIGRGLYINDSHELEFRNLSVAAPTPATIFGASELRITGSGFLLPQSAAATPFSPSGYLQLTDVSTIVFANTSFERTRILLDDDIQDVDFNHIQIRTGQIIRSGFGEGDGLSICGSKFYDKTDTPTIDATFISNVSLQNNHFFNTTGGVDLSGDNITVENNLFNGSGRALGIRSTQAVIHNNSFALHSDGVSISSPHESGAIADLRFNWWGHPTGPSGAGSGSGATLSVSGKALFDPWLESPPEVDAHCKSGKQLPS